ncbi:MAG: BamA/TamA family outer membrane protein [Maricaulaceae bacterium]|nr:BamA/TamA family outer membrane protein [Maricaulaceae bacterium]
MQAFSRHAAALAALIALAAPAAAEPFAHVRGVDDPALRERLQGVIGEADSRPAGPREARDRAERAAELAVRALRSEGYYAGRVRPMVEAGAAAAVIVEPGPLYRFESVEMRIDGPAPLAVRAAAGAALGLFAGAPVRAADVLDAEQRALESIRESGRPDATAAPREIVVDHASQTATAVFTLLPGRYAEFGVVRVEEGAPLRPGFVARLAPFAEGEPARPSALRVYTADLNALEGVRLASATLGAFDDGSPRREVMVGAEAGPRHRLAAGAGYSTADGAGAETEWTRRNLFGGAETLILDARAAEIEISAGARLRIPHWRRRGQTLTLGLRAQQRRTDAFDRDALSFRAAVTRALTPRIAANAATAFETARVTDFAGRRNVNAADFALGLVWDGRDDALDPQQGFRLEGAAEPSFVFDGGDVQYLRLTAGASHYLPVSETVVIAGRVRLASITGASAAAIPADRRLYAGGGGSARGYAFQSLSPLNPDGTPFGGVSLAEAGVEARWRYNESWGFAAFVDAAAAGPDTTPDVSAMRAAFGLGVRWYTGFGPIRLDVATPLDRRPGDRPLHFYISMGQAF